MRKLTTITLTVIIATLLLFALTACSNGDLAIEVTTTPTPTPEVIPTPTPTPTPTPELEPDPLPTVTVQYSIGDSVRFGGYDWIILDVRDGKALLLTENIIAFYHRGLSDDAYEALDILIEETMSTWRRLSDFEGFSLSDDTQRIFDAYRSYRDENPEVVFARNYVSWENSPIRTWLNSEMRFTASEWELIETTEIIDKTGRGANTSDKVFLLDIDDVRHYFPQNETRGASLNVSDDELLRFLKHSTIMGQLSPALANIALAARGDGEYYWWVREVDEDFDSNFYLVHMSTDALRGYLARAKRGAGVRPALWIRLDNLSPLGHAQ